MGRNFFVLMMTVRKLKAEMKISKTTTHSITFTVRGYHYKDDAIYCDHISKDFSYMIEALNVFEECRLTRPELDWKIVGEVVTETKTN